MSHSQPRPRVIYDVNTATAIKVHSLRTYDHLQLPTDIFDNNLKAKIPLFNMSHTIFISNLSNHDQEFEVHGWNNNQNMTVPANSTNTIQANDGSSGAIIALHDGFEGEQAEITKDGFGGVSNDSIVKTMTANESAGNDFLDLSNIVGAGGNMLVQQVNDPSTAKGDPLFMQHLNAAWANASPETKAGLSNCVFTQGDTVIRIGPIKDFPNLETFVRSFADGLTYIGVGAWGGSPGNGSDNAQSSAAHGNKDILVTYNDGDATPPANLRVQHNVQRHPVPLSVLFPNSQPLQMATLFRKEQPLLLRRIQVQSSILFQRTFSSQGTQCPDSSTILTRHLAPSSTIAVARLALTPFTTTRPLPTAPSLPASPTLHQ